MRAPGTIALSLALLLGVFASLLAAPGLDGLFGAALAALMLAIAVVDRRRFLIPDELTAAAGLLALLRALVTGDDPGWPALAMALLQGIVTAAPLLLLMLGYRHWRGRDGLGLGDVKLAAVAGAWLDWPTIFAVIELAALAALAVSIALALIRKRPLRATMALPFGVFLAPAIWFGWLAERLLGS